ncbi:hypothetical protein J14TS2_17970 [Bacillus sp. J14TS2]|nr:hypothetical protein J14TS2_17970 [Bacillus sp. J14TS2]
MYTATIVSCETGNQYEVIRQVLEAFEFRVIHEVIGRPTDFIQFLSGERYLSSDFLIFSFHGVDGKFCMPELGEDVYYDNEPRGNFGAEEISEYCQLKAPFIINLGCGLGNEKLAASFLSNACETYIGPNDYIDWTSSGFFAIRFFYELYQNKRSKKEAFEVARGTDSETMLYEWFE